MKRLVYFCAVFLPLALCVAGKVFPYSFNAYNGITGKEVLSFSPALCCPLSPEFGAALDLITSYGFTSEFDIFADLANFNLAPEAGYAFSWIMPRFEFLPGHIVGLQLQLNNSDLLSFNIIPQYHFFYESDAFALELNAAVNIPINNPASFITVGGIAAPVWKAVKDILYPFIEIDPSYAFGENGAFALNVVPGIWVGIPGTPHQFCLAFTLSDVTSGNPGYGVNLWYSVSLNLIPE
jgi:hypothetical protein